MTNRPGVDPGTTEVPFKPRPAPVSTDTATAPKITINNTDNRQIDNLRLSANFSVNDQPYYDYEIHGTFNQVGVDGLSGWNGIVNEDGRGITGLRITAEFTINGQRYIDYEDIGNFDRHYFLELNGMNGSWNGSEWVGNFLKTKRSGFDTQIDPGLLTFLNVLVYICMAANAAAAAKGAAGVIERNFSAEYAGGPGGGGFKLSQIW